MNIKTLIVSKDQSIYKVSYYVFILDKNFSKFSHFGNTGHIKNMKLTFSVNFVLRIKSQILSIIRIKAENTIQLLNFICSTEFIKIPTIFSVRIILNINQQRKQPMKINEKNKTLIYEEMESVNLEDNLDVIVSALLKIKEEGIKKGFDKFEIERNDSEGLYHCVIASRLETDQEYLRRAKTQKEKQKEADLSQYETYLILKEKFEN